MKKSQISMFVVIGIVLIIGIIFFLSFKNNNLSFYEDGKSSYKVKKFVENCIYEITNLAQEKVAQSGGKLYYQEKPIFPYDSHPNIIKKSSGFQDIGKINFYYWYYYDDSDKEFVVDIPEYSSESTYSIKNQIKRFVKENIEDECFKNFKDFEDEFRVNYEIDEINLDLKFNYDEIETNLDLKFEIYELATESFESLSSFSKTQHNKIRVPFFLAKDIIEAQKNSSFLEIRQIQLISPYQISKKKNLLPPFYDFKIGYDFSPWDLRETEKLFAQIMNSHIGEIKFLSTYQDPKDFSSSENEFVFGASKIYKKNYLEDTTLTENYDDIEFFEFRNYKVKTKYELFYPLSFSIFPSLGNTFLFPETKQLIENVIPLFTTTYTSRYQTTMPIVFEISNKDSSNLIFQFGVETNIKNNKPLKYVNSQQETLSPPTQNSGYSLVCNPNQFISGEYTLSFADYIDNGNRKSSSDLLKGVDDALILFSCKGFKKCYLGKTKINGDYRLENFSKLNFKLPVNCKPGTLEIYKFGHNKIVVENLDPQIGKNIDLGNFSFDSTKKITPKIKLCSSTHLCSGGRSLRQYEEGFVFFENKKNSELTKVLEIDFENQYDLEIELSTGNYDIIAFIISNKKTVVTGKEICTPSGLFDEDCHTIPDINLTSWLVGEYEFQDFEITKEDLISNSEIVLRIQEQKVPKTFDELSEVASTLGGNLKDISPVFTN